MSQPMDFDGLARAMAAPMPRRRAVGMALGAISAVALGALRPSRALAVTCSGPTNAPCGAGTTPCGPCCCRAGIACVNLSTGQCGCPAGTTRCGTTCCQSGVACASPTTGTCRGAAAACLNPGANACGSTCCPSGQPCIDGKCGCPPGTACGDTCCSTGTTCVGTDCALSGTICPSGPTCNGGLLFCGGTANCACFTKVSGGFFCANTNDLTGSCTSDSNCQTGETCVVTPNCGIGANTCAKPCTS